jgi:uncharacterized membrane protein YfcA
MLTAVEPAEIVLIWLGVAAAAVLRAFTGFGFGLAAVPLFSLFMLPSQAVVLSSSLTLAISLLSVKTYWGIYPVKTLSPILAAAVPGTLVGVLVLSSISVRQFQLWIGLAVIGACIALVVYKPRLRQPIGAVGGLTGLVSGVLNGAFAIPGPPVIIYSMATQTDPARSRSLLMTFFLFSSLLALTAYGLVGFITPVALGLFVLAFPAMFAGDRIGYRLFLRFGSELYRRIAIAVLAAAGISVICRSLH